MRKYLNQITAAAVCFVLSLTILASVLLLRGGSFYLISNEGTKSADGKITNSILVSGDGKVYAIPDIAKVSLTVSKLAPNTATAVDFVNKGIDQTKKILADKGISDSDIQTSTYNITAEYNYSSSQRYLEGQRVTHTLTIQIKNIDQNSKKLSEVIDSVAKVDGLEINYIDFDIFDKTKIYSQARELAYKKAEQKAKELASLSDLTLLKPVSIEDTNVASALPFRSYQVNTASLASGAADKSTSDIAPGQYEVSVSLQINFGVRP